MPPPEVADLVQCQKVESSGGWLLQGVGFQGQGCRARFHVFEEFAVVARSVGAEILKDGGEWCVGHGDLEEIVA